MAKRDLIRFILCAIDWLIRKMLGILGHMKYWILTAMWGVDSAGGGAFIGEIVLRNTKRGRIRFGKDIVIQSSFRMNPIGSPCPSLIDVRPGGLIEIGDGSGMTSVIISSGRRIAIGRYCKIGGGTKIIDHNYHAMDAEARRNMCGDVEPREILIGDDVFIGTNAIILKGTKIGSRSVIAAGSVVFGLDIPPDSLVRGNPAEIVQRKK